MQVVLISGLSGSGKSVALRSLEDAGFYCIDNLPAPFLPQLVGFLDATREQRLAIGIDARSFGSLADLPAVLDQLRLGAFDVHTVFLDATTDSLVKRFAETRRPHPLADGQKTLAECIALERDLMAHVGEIAQRIDTSELSANQLRGLIRDVIGSDASRVTLYLQSFGFKRGVPQDADFMFDARCLPNPHYDPVLKPLTGLDRAVADYLERETDALALVDDIEALITRWLPRFKRELRRTLSIAVGCTGGQHRSVYIVDQLARRFGKSEQVICRHRELAPA